MTEIYVIEIPILEITLGDFENCEPLKKVQLGFRIVFSVRGHARVQICQTETKIISWCDTALGQSNCTVPPQNKSFIFELSTVLFLGNIHGNSSYFNMKICWENKVYIVYRSDLRFLLGNFVNM